MDEIRSSQLEWVQRCRPNQCRKAPNQSLGIGCQVRLENRHLETVEGRLGSWTGQDLTKGVERNHIHFSGIVDPFQDASLEHVE